MRDGPAGHPATRPDLSALADLRLAAGEIGLRFPGRVDLEDLAALAAQGIHPPEHTPFAVPWTDLAGEEFRAAFLAYHDGCAANWHTDEWELNLAVRAGSVPVGVQGIRGTRQDGELTVSTGSWLGRSHQGRGYGTLMRAAILELAFAGLGATAATSAAVDRNHASARVSRKLGYHAAGTAFSAPRGYPLRETVFRIERDTWLAGPVREGITIDGLEGCRELFGVT